MEAGMRIACWAAGRPTYFAIAMKLRDAAHEIVVVERNRPYDTFGWVWCCRTRRSLTSRPQIPRAPRRSARLRLLGRHRRLPPGAVTRSSATASAASP